MFSLFGRTDYEQQYINYLAGEKSGRDFIQRQEKNLASRAESHPKSNFISASIAGPLNALGATAVATAAYTLKDNFDVVFGPAEKIIAQCGLNQVSVGLNAAKHTIWERIASIWNALYHGNSQEAWSSLAGFPDMVKNMIKSAADVYELDQKLKPLQPIPCSLFNFGYATYNTMQEHKLAVLYVVAVTTGLFSMWANASYEKNEQQAQQELVDRLQDRFSALSKKLEDDYKRADVQGRKAIKDTASKINANEQQIKTELKGLKVLSSKEIRSIYAPLSAALRTILA